MLRSCTVGGIRWFAAGGVVPNSPQYYSIDYRLSSALVLFVFAISYRHASIRFFFFLFFFLKFISGASLHPINTVSFLAFAFVRVCVCACVFIKLLISTQSSMVLTVLRTPLIRPDIGCVCVCVFIKLHITTQSGPVILVILCHSH